MNMRSLDINLSRKYNGSCAHLDTWLTIGQSIAYDEEVLKDEGDTWTTQFKLTVFPNAFVDRPFNFGESYDKYHPPITFRESPVSQDLIEHAIHDTFTRQGCSHDYDCCGCVSTYVTEIEKLYGNQYIVTCRHSRNY